MRKLNYQRKIGAIAAGKKIFATDTVPGGMMICTSGTGIPNSIYSGNSRE